MQHIIQPGTEYSMGSIASIKDKALNEEADMAYRLIERWGMVAGIPDGEDSAGRQRLRLMTPEELVNRAYETARLFWNIADARGMVASLTKEEVDSIRQKPKKEKTVLTTSHSSNNNDSSNSTTL